MDERLKQYCDIGKHFLFKAHSIQDLLVESQNTQIYLMEIIQLRGEFQAILNRAENKFEMETASERENRYQYAIKYGIKGATAQVLDDQIRKYMKNYLSLKEEFDEAKLNFDMCNSLMMAFFQRKDMIIETIKFFKSKQESDSCIVNNLKILKKLGIE